MRFLELFYIASIPVIKVLLITALGLFLAMDCISILGEDARKKVNNLVFYVFNPSLVGSSLAKTITLESLVLLWFMPVNLLATVILGSALGWILIIITRPPKRLQALILGCCAAGNVGNLPMIIIPALCKEKGSPFGDAEVCYENGMAYVSLSMAIGAVYFWSYVYNIMRISASKVHREDNTSDEPSKLKASGEISESLLENGSETLNPEKGAMDDVEVGTMNPASRVHREDYTSDEPCKLKASGEISESSPDNGSEARNPAKEAMDDAYATLLPETESEEKAKVPILVKIKRWLGMISSKMNIKSILAPSTIGAIVGFCVGVIGPVRHFLIGDNAPLHVVEATVAFLGDAAIPTVTLILGANLLRGLKRTNTPVWTIVGIIAVRYIFLPVLGVVVLKGAIHFGWVHSNPLYQFVLLLQFALPPAMNIGIMAQLFGTGEGDYSVIMLWTYAFASVAVTLWSTYFIWLVS